MEDGSIFVCFLCEKEFRQVAALQEHMTEHGTLPEMSQDFPSRKRGKGSKEGNHRAVTRRPRAASRSLGTRKASLQQICVPKKIIPVASSTKMIAKAENKEMSVKQDKFPSVKVKCESDAPQTEFSLATKRAMRIKQYVQRYEEKSQPVKRGFDFEEAEIDELNLMDFEGAQESIMMVDSSFFSSGSSTKTPIGPTIMNAEPEGFMCPIAQKSNPLFSNNKKMKKNIKMKSKYIVKDVYEDKEVAYEDNSDDNEDTNSFESETTDVRPFRAKPLKFKPLNRGRGRGRPKKSRPPILIKEELLDEDDETEGYFKEVSRPGRRSQPRNSYSDDGPTYQCLECYKEFRSISTMKVHMKAHSEDREIPCPYCDEIFPQRYILYEHLVNDHEESSNLTCPVCSKIFTRPDSLKSHMVRMHEENGGLNCLVCGKNFPSQGQLEMHVRVHTGERPFKCNLCSKGFVQKVHLRTHLRTMHNMTDMLTTPCRICNEKLNGRAGLRDHYTAEHGLTTAQYKSQVARLRKEGKIPDILPPVVKVVDPSFRYQNVSVLEMEDDLPCPEVIESQAVEPPQQNGVSSSTTSRGGKSAVYLTRKSGRKFKIKSGQFKANQNTPGMGTVMNMNLLSDEDMFTPISFDLEGDQRKGRDQEELNIVESAFKVAEEMDQLREGNSTIIMSGDDSSSSGLYYSLPMVLNSSSSVSLDGNPPEVKVNGASSSASSTQCQLQTINMPEDDEEYAQFAAEHAHIDGGEGFEEVNMQGSNSHSRRGAIVKAKPLDIYSDSMGTSQAVEMLTM